MKGDDKREAMHLYKERKRAMGIYAVTCAASGQAWVGQTRNLDTQASRIWFALRLGSERPASLQDAWNAHGAEAFNYSVLAQLDDADTAFPEASLKALLADWRERLNAIPI